MSQDMQELLEAQGNLWDDKSWQDEWAAAPDDGLSLGALEDGGTWADVPMRVAEPAGLKQVMIRTPEDWYGARFLYAFLLTDDAAEALARALTGGKEE